METQVVIIGGGVAGTMLARELSKYKVDVILVEKKPDVGFGVSKCSNGYIYRGLLWQLSMVLKSIVTGTVVSALSETELKAQRWCAEGYDIWKKSLLTELDIPNMKLPVMLVATNDQEMEILNLLEKQTRASNNPCRRVNKEEIVWREPHVTPNVISGLYDDELGVTCTYGWDIVEALAENAQQNGVNIMLDTEVIGISKNGGFQIVETTKGPIKTDFIINAAEADGLKVAKMADACDFTLTFFKAHLIVMDKKLSELVKGYLAILAGPGKLKGVHRTISGNLLLSAIYKPTKLPHDLAADKAVLDELFSWCHDVVPSLLKRDIISYFAVSRVYSGRDPEEYIVEFAPRNPRFINMIFRMPGFVPAPVIAKEVVEMLAGHGLPLPRKDDFNPYRKRSPRFSELSDEEKRMFIAQDPRYGHVICRCETVTEGEIVETIRRGATTLDGVKFRTRAGMGRCQSGFCGPRVVDILSKELNIKPTRITKNGGSSRILLGETKQLLKA